MKCFLKKKTRNGGYNKKENFLDNFLFRLLAKKTCFFAFFFLSLFLPFFVTADASLSLSPSSGTHEERSVFSVNVLLRGGGDAVNAILSFDNNLLMVESISEAASVVEAWSPGGRPRHSGGSITFSGGIPGGLRGTEGNIITVNFRAIRTGTASLSFTKGTVLRAGEKLDADLGRASYTIKEASSTPTTPPSAPPGGDPPTLEDDFSEENIVEGEGFFVEIDNEGDPANPTPVFVINKSDDLPETKYYEIFLNDELHDTIFPDDLEDERYRVSSLPPGDYLLEVRAFDEDDNHNSASENFSVVPAPLEIREISSSISEGTPLTIIGQTLPRSTVKINILLRGFRESWNVDGGLEGETFRKEGEGTLFLKEVVTDDEGNFTFENHFPKGEYLVWLEVEDEEGVVRSTTEEFFLEIKSEGMMSIIIILLLFLILVGIGLIAYFHRKIKKKKEKQMMLEESSSEEEKEAYETLEKKIKEQINYLEEKTDLSRGEKRVLEGLKGALDTVHEGGENKTAV